MPAKFAPRCGARAIRKSKSLKTGMSGAFFEVQVRKICTTLWRESEVKIVARDVFGGSNCVLRGRRKDFGTWQNTWQAQEFVRIAKTLAGVVDLKRVWKDVFCVASAGVSCFALLMFQAKCYVAEIISRGRSLYASPQLFRGRRSTFEASAWKPLKRIGILRPSVWSTCRFWRKSRKDASFLSFNFCFLRKSGRKAAFLSFQVVFLKEVSQKSFVFEFPSQASLFDLQVQSIESHITWTSHQLDLTSTKSQINRISNFEFETIRISNQWKFEAVESQTNCNSIQLNLKSVPQTIWISKRKALTTEPLESQSSWTANHLYPKLFESQINWFSKQLNLESVDNRITESQSSWTPNRLNLESIAIQPNWLWNQLNPKSSESQSSWIANQLTTKSLKSQINGISKQWNLKSFEFQAHWNHLKFKTSEINRLSNHLNSTHFS